MQVVVDRKIMEKKLLPLLSDKPTMLPAWDPMGSLAMVGRDSEGLLREEHLMARCRI